jgi:hypothetical protein
MFNKLKSFIYRGQEGVEDSSELFRGVAKPTTTLAHTLVSEMLRSDDSICFKVDLAHQGETYEKYRDFYDFPSFQLTIREGYSSRRTSLNGTVGHCFKVVVKKTIVEFSKEEIEILQKGWIKYKELTNERRRLKQEHDNQQAALDAISNLFGPPISEEKETKNVTSSDSAAAVVQGTKLEALPEDVSVVSVAGAGTTDILGAARPRKGRRANPAPSLDYVPWRMDDS